MSFPLDTFALTQLSLDYANEIIATKMVANAADAYGRGIDLTVTDHGSPVDLTGLSIYFIWRHSQGAQGTNSFEITDAANGRARVYYPAGMMAMGTVTARISIALGNDVITGSRNFKITVEPNPVDSDDAMANDDFSAFVEAMQRMDDNITDEVDAWLTAHPEATTTVQPNTVTDAMLVQSGGVLEDMSSVRNTSEFNLIKVGQWEQGTINGQTGADLESVTRLRTDYIEVSEISMINYVVASGYKIAWHYYDSGKTRNGGSPSWVTGSGFIAVPSTAGYIRFLLSNTSDSVILPSEVSNVTATYSTPFNSLVSKVLNTGWKEKTVTVPAGATGGQWVTLIGFDAPIMVRCDSPDVVSKYRMWTSTSSFETCDVGVMYKFDNIRGDTSEIQIYLGGLVKSNGTVVGGNVTFTFALQDDVIVSNTYDGFIIKDNTIGYDKLSDDAKAKINDDAKGTVISDAYVQTNVDAVCSALDEVQTENTSSIFFMTDLHLKAFDDLTDATFLPVKRAKRAVEKINESNMVDFCVLGGDYLWNNATGSTKARAKNAYSFLQQTFYSLRDKLFALKGNHDDNSIALSGIGLNAVIYPDEVYRYAGKQYERSGTVYNVGDHNFYGYYDIPSQKIRCIFVNTVDIPYIVENDTLVYNGQHNVAISQEQSEFIQDALVFDETGWSVVFFSHHGLVQSSVHGTNTEDYCSDLWNIITAYKNKTAYSGTVANVVDSYSVSVDYTNNASNDVIACITGHNHADRSAVVDGILIVSTGAACQELSSEVDGTSQAHVYESSTETIFDIFTVDTENRKLYATRYGLGNSREWTY